MWERAIANGGYLSVRPSVCLPHSWSTLNSSTYWKPERPFMLYDRAMLDAHFSVVRWASCLTLTMFGAQYRLPLIFWPKLTHPAVRSLCNSSASCFMLHSWLINWSIDWLIVGIRATKKHQRNKTHKNWLCTVYGISRFIAFVAFTTLL